MGIDDIFKEGDARRHEEQRSREERARETLGRSRQFEKLVTDELAALIREVEPSFQATPGPRANGWAESHQADRTLQITGGWMTNTGASLEIRGSLVNHVDEEDEASELTFTLRRGGQASDFEVIPRFVENPPQYEVDRDTFRVLLQKAAREL